jgi:hypothetical protein
MIVMRLRKHRGRASGRKRWKVPRAHASRGTVLRYPAGVRSNLIETLLRFADGSRPREEDPITEVLAWLLAHEPALLECFCNLLGNTASNQRARTFRLREPSVRTQVVAQGIAGRISRYDLVLEKGQARAVVELKVRSGLTLSRAEDADAAAVPEQRHQLHDYLAQAGTRIAQGDDQLVFALAVGFVDVGEAVHAHPCWGGSLTWQTVHDAFARRLRVPGETPLDPATKMIAEQLLGTMEVRRMATPRMTLDGAVSVRRASRFRQSVTAALEAAWQELHADGTLDGFTKINRSAWQEEDRWTRMGYRLWALSSDTNHYGFMGIWYGDETLVEDVPDLYFFLQVKPDGRAGEALHERSEQIRERLTALNSTSTHARWRHAPDMWTPVSCVSSLAPFLLDADPSTAIRNWFRTTLAAARKLGLLEIYFEAIKRLGRPAVLSGDRDTLGAPRSDDGEESKSS